VFFQNLSTTVDVCFDLRRMDFYEFGSGCVEDSVCRFYRGLGCVEDLVCCFYRKTNKNYQDVCMRAPEQAHFFTYHQCMSLCQD
jgi:hypothetical protein